jgi:protein SCO1/2
MTSLSIADCRLTIAERILSAICNRYSLIVIAVFLSGPIRLWASTPAQQNQYLSQVDFEQKLNAQVPLRLTFRDEAGQRVRLSDVVRDKPVVLSLVYYQCPMLCTESLNGLLRAIRSIKFTAGEQYRILTVSFDPSEIPKLASAKKNRYVERYGRTTGAAGWHFWVGDADPIRALTQSVGFHYAYDPELRQYAHSTGLVILTPDGRVSRYLFGVEYSARDLELGLIEASSGQIGSPVDKILLYCYHYDPLTGKYNLRIMRILQGAAGMTLLALGLFIGFHLRSERKAAATA